jgi:hypothetical protein
MARIGKHAPYRDVFRPETQQGPYFRFAEDYGSIARMPDREAVE